MRILNLGLADRPGKQSEHKKHNLNSASKNSNMRHYATCNKEKLGITFISKGEIPVKSPDTSPLDFYGFGFLKQRRRPKTLDGVWKVLKEDWNRVSTETVAKGFDAWNFRLRLVSKKGGQHIEHTKAIHTRKL